MTARRSSSDPVSHHLERGERIVWRHKPSARSLFYNRLPAIIFVVALTVFVILIGVSVVVASAPPLPVEPNPSLIVPAGAALFLLALVYIFIRACWTHLRALLDSWDTHYALTNRRFLVVAGRRAFAYDAACFRKMEPLGGEAGKHVLMFDWGVGRRRREYYRDRLAGLPDAAKLEALIRQTLHA